MGTVGLTCRALLAKGFAAGVFVVLLFTCIVSDTFVAVFGVPILKALKRYISDIMSSQVGELSRGTKAMKRERHQDRFKKNHSDQYIQYDIISRV